MCVLIFFDWVLFVILSITTVYLLVFSLFSLRKLKLKLKESSKLSKVVVLFPVYKEDKVIITSVKSFLKQTYENANYKVVVIADHLLDDTISELETFGIDVLQVQLEQSTKANALNYAMTQINTDDFEVVVILDADNEVDPTFLVDINQAYQNGCMSIQAHRVAKNFNTSITILDAVSEEINNSIFRKGHNNAGLSSALIGSGIAFDLKWFKKHIEIVTSKKMSVAEDKDLELQLHEQNIFIQYLNDVYVYDFKTDSGVAFYRQRRRWQSAQFQIIIIAFRQMNKEVCKSVSWDYWDKLLQWVMLPRALSFALVLLCAIVTSLFLPALTLKWGGLLVVFTLAMLFATPRKLYNIQLLKAIPHIPILCVMMFLNLFQQEKERKHFIHTKHSKH